MELCFALAPRQNLFFVELVEAIRHELDALGVASSVSRDGFPPPRQDLVYVLVPPHEYVALQAGDEPPDALLRRTLFISAEQPGTVHFEQNAALAPRGGAIFDISRHATREYRMRGLEARYLQIGHGALWDRFDPERERDVDVLFLGCLTPRRSRHLAAYADSLWRWRTRVLLSDNSRPNSSASATFVAGEEKWDLLNRSKVVINLQQGEEPYFEWLRMAQAISNGACVVTEHSTDFAPLAPGTHFLTGHGENLALLAQALLEDDGRRRRMQQDAYALLRERASLSDAVRELVAAAEEVARRPVEATALGAPSPVAIAGPGIPAPPVAEPDDGVAVARAGIKDLRLGLLALDRRLQTLRSELHGRPTGVQVDRTTPAYRAARPRVSVIVTVYDYGRHIGRALDSVAAGRFRDLELVVVDDGSGDDSADRVRAWMDRHPRVPALLARHPTNRGLPHARNTALAFARAPLTFVLDADNEVYPHGVERLVEALDGDPGATLAYGFHQCFTHAGPDALANLWPWEPERLREGNYIDAMALVRTRAVRAGGGYTTDSRLHGWEDFELWCRLAEEGHRAAFVPEVVARYRRAKHSMLSLTNLSSTTAFSVLAERYPSVMGAAAAA